MIALLEGRLIDAGEDTVLLQVGGVGFEVSVPRRSVEAMPQPGESVRLLTYLHVREDVLHLYGFAEAADRDLFRTLTSVSGVGPSLALAVLSALTVETFCQAVLDNNEAVLRRVSGVGPKVAKRLVFELTERIKKMEVSLSAKAAVGGDGPAADAIAAMTTLGTRPALAEAAVKRALEELPHLAQAEPGEILREALKRRGE